jgi:hypothetical protein
MKDKLRNFIRSNRESFDDKEPSERVWSQISRELLGKQRSLTPLIYWRAAAVIFMCLSIILLYSKFSESRSSKLVLHEFQDVESFYTLEISNKIEMIENYHGAEKGLNGFTHDFNQLEAMYEVLKDEMKSHPTKKVKDALVLNLLVRIDLLNMQLEKLENENQDEGDEEGQDSRVSI